MSKEVACLIWTEDDVIGAMEDNGIELTDENIKRAVKAVENDGMEFAMQHVNEDMRDVVEEAFI